MKPKFLIGLGLIVASIAAVITFAIMGNSSMEVRVNDLLAKQQRGEASSDRSFKLIGLVVGDSIRYDAQSLRLEFDVVNDREHLLNHTKAPRVRVVYFGAKPDTLVHEASAIVTGRLSEDGKFYAANTPDSLLLQCPTKYDSAKEATR
ncbi:MAG: cytochrome c maturation protein CcmE [Thermoflexales bacterium]